MNDLEKLQVVLPHWIEHNRGHAQECSKWTELVAACDGGEAVHAHLAAALKAMEAVGSHLEEALAAAGGEMGEGHSHHHHHHH